MMNGFNCRQNRNRGRCGISHLRKGRAGVAELAGEEVVFEANLVAAACMDVTELMQQRALLSENQQQRQEQRKADAGSIHGHVKHCTTKLSTRHAKSALGGFYIQRFLGPGRLV